jgi:putative tryptophan/tyrosine transport system substrate-binding protein
MRRRDFITFVGGTAVAWPLSAYTQTLVPRPVVGVLVGASTQTGTRWLRGFLQGMQDLGYVEHQNVSIIERNAGGDVEQLPRLAEELIQAHPAVMVASPTVSVLTVKRLTTAIPIVCPTLANPIGFGLVKSYAHPEGQVTGLMGSLDTLPGKQLQVGREIIPGANKIGVLINNAFEALLQSRPDPMTADKVAGLAG